MAICHHLERLSITIHPSSTKAENNPFALCEMLASRFQSVVDAFKQFCFVMSPKLSVMAERAIKLLSSLDDFFVDKRFTAL